MKLINLKNISRLLMIMIIPAVSMGQNILPKITMGVEEASGPSDLVMTMQIIFLITILSLAPSILIMMTSFTRLVIVFHFLRSALATQTVPSNQILIGLALFISIFIMKPVITEINDTALQPYLNEEITQKEALEIYFGTEELARSVEQEEEVLGPIETNEPAVEETTETITSSSTSNSEHNQNNKEL